MVDELCKMSNFVHYHHWQFEVFHVLVSSAILGCMNVF